MKRFIIGAVAAAALVVPAGASAVEVSTTPAPAATAAPHNPIPQCPNRNLTYCIKYWVDHYLATDADLIPTVAAPCTTPVMPCVEAAIARAFTTLQNGVTTAKGVADYVVGELSKPPNVDAVCYAIWGQPCSSEMITG
jgi:hypothetical protein